MINYFPKRTATLEAFLSGSAFPQVRIIYVPWLIPHWASAQTWWNVILVKRGGELTKRLLAHELAHVLQWRTLGVFPFMFHYACHLIRHGYDAHPLEIEARAAETKNYYLEWAEEILQANKPEVRPF